MRAPTSEEKARKLESISELTELHDKIISSVYRQKYHVIPLSGLMNDPNGFSYYNDEWHLFYQWSPFGAFHGMKYWYHTKSKDLVHFTNAGAALKPDNFYDNHGCWSGSAYVDDEHLHLYYTGNHYNNENMRKQYTMHVCLKDDQFIKDEHPLTYPQDGYTEHQRDPQIIYHNNKYYILIGGENQEHHGRLLLYENDQLDSTFHFAGEIKVPQYEEFGTMWECPSLMRFGDTDLLMFCPLNIELEGRANQQTHSGYLLGTMDFENLTFTPKSEFRFFDAGFDFYAPQPASNTTQFILSGWMGTLRSSYPTDEEDWSGCLSLPRVLSIKDNMLYQNPIEAIQTLKKEEADLDSRILPTSCLIELETRHTLNLNLFTPVDGHGGFMIYYNQETNNMIIDKSGMSNRFNKEFGESREYKLSKPLTHLRIFIDASSIEIFVNDGEAVFTSRIFPTEEEHSFIFVGTGEMHIYKLEESNDNQLIL